MKHDINDPQRAWGVLSAERQYSEGPSAYLTAHEAAAYLRLAVQTLARWRCDKSDGPKFTRAGRKILYAKSDLDAYLEARICASTSDAGK